MAVSVARIWPLERYARYTPESTAAVLPVRGGKKGGGVWQHFSSKEGGIQMALLQSNHLMITSGNQIYESFSLWGTGKWIQGVTKGDSILFIYRLKEENRRFRIKFSSMASNSTPMKTCRDCIAALAPLVPIREMPVGSVTDSQVPYDESQAMSQTQSHVTWNQTQYSQGGTQALLDSGSELPGTSTNPMDTVDSDTNGASGTGSGEVAGNGVNMICHESERRSNELGVDPMDSAMMPIPELAKSLLAEGKPLGRAYADTNFPTDQLGSFIRLCLTDANFPGFVEAVEKELNTITSSGK